MREKTNKGVFMKRLFYITLLSCTLLYMQPVSASTLQSMRDRIHQAYAVVKQKTDNALQWIKNLYHKESSHKPAQEPHK